MNLKRARYIMAICEAGGITAAAKKLFISQPSLSQTVRQVEKELGVAVFEEGITPPKLTYAGEQYLKTAQAMIGYEEDLYHILDSIRQEERGRLRIGVSIQRGIQLLPMVLPKFTSRYPDVQIILEEKGSEDLERLVESGQIDLALATTEPSNHNLDYTLIESESYVLLTHRENTFALQHTSGAPVELAEAKDETFIALKKGHNSRAIQDKVFSQCGISPTILCESDSLEGAMRMAVACRCCMLCPLVFVRDNNALLRDGVYFPLKNITEPRHFYACFRKEKYLPQYMRDFIQMVQDTTSQSLANSQNPS